MRNYLKPAIEMEAFDVEDIITASGAGIQESQDSNEGYGDNFASASVWEEVDFN